MNILRLVFLLMAVTACQTENKTEAPSDKGLGQANEQITVPSINELTANFQTWYAYTLRNVRLAHDFTGLSVDAKPVDKSTFLTNIWAGDVIPLKIKQADGVPVYKLYRVHSLRPDIRSTVREMARNELANYKLEGTKLPTYDFTDLNGHRYNRSTTAGKYVLLKAWFIHCVACVREFPELNELVSDYTARPDLLFVSLALDSRSKLLPFLQKKPFSYAVVPDAEPYLDEMLGIRMYPTHILVDTQGQIMKVTNSMSDMRPFLAKHVPNTR